ncbi:MAG: tetratricopeptide repeat protein [Deltaproteobacteria bacterium]|nr:tetratricopeptide repeat protein [Deltaproteobacteria bacterium]
MPAPKAPSPALNDELSFADLDLPAPKAPSPAVDDEMSFAGLDLPAPKGAGADLPAPKAPSPSLDDEMSFAGLDLPAPKGAGADLPAPKGAGVDLPAPKGAGADLPAPKGAGADLPVPKGAGAGLPVPKGAGADLPVPKGAGGMGFGDLDFPTPNAGVGAAILGGDLLGDLDLPPPRSAGGAGAGELFGDLDLPTPKGAAAGLPVAKGTSDLPVPRDEGDLFGGGGAGGAGFGELDLPGIDDGFDDIDLLGSVPAPDLGGPGADAGGGLSGRGGTELDLPLPGDESGGMDTSDGRAGAGGVGFGEIDLGEEGGDGMEFADLPQERDGSMPGRVSQATIDVVKDERTLDREARQRDAAAAGDGKASRSKLPFLALGLVVLIAGLGVGGGFMPGIGYFGIYLAEGLLPEAGDAGAVQAAVTSAEEVASSDTYEGVRASLRTLADARTGMGLNRPLLARSLVHESLFLTRFGDDPASVGRADNIRRRLEERGHEGPDMLLATAATALATGAAGASQARGFADQARGALPDDPYVDLVAAEAALLQGDPEAARELFAAALTKGGGARAQWGLARALLALGSDEASEAVDATLDASRRHAEARVAKATLLFAAENATAARTLAQEAAGVLDVGDARLRTTPLTRSAAFTLIGQIAEREGNRRDAREAYEAALEANAFGVQALVGAGRAHLVDERWRDALTNFEAAIDTVTNSGEAPGEEVPEGHLPLVAEARLGAARAMLRLDRELDAKRTLEQLVAAYPESGAISLWLGRVAEALDDSAGAEARYREAIVLSPDTFEPYLALAQLFFDSDRHEAAGEVLTQAGERVDESVVMRRLLGESELGRRRYGDAVREFERALELDATDIAARYGLGVAHRRSGDLEAANVAFAQVSEVDPTWPGLALERGLVFEARGESDEAVRAYTLALEGRPDDPDLLLRLGAAYVTDGRVDEAEETLRRVQESRPNSAEVEHFMGRVELERGNLPVAVNHFSRSIALDATRGEFHLYVAWAALEMGNLGRALDEVNAAIELDPSLGDAFWIRGRVRLRGGAVRDALADLRHALELKPSRYEAYASMAESYDGLRRIPEAIEAYKRALERDNSKGQWWYRLGRLQLDAGRRGEAVPSLERATLIGGALADPPVWLSDAHRLLGDILRTSNRTEAIAHYRHYLEVAPDNAIDRNHVRDVLMDMGESP